MKSKIIRIKDYTDPVTPTLLERFSGFNKPKTKLVVRKQDEKAALLNEIDVSRIKLISCTDKRTATINMLQKKGFTLLDMRLYEYFSNHTPEIPEEWKYVKHISFDGTLLSTSLKSKKFYSYLLSWWTDTENWIGGLDPIGCLQPHELKNTYLAVLI